MVCLRTKESAALICEINITDCEIRETSSIVRYICSILRLMATLDMKFQQEVINTHTRKTARLLYRETNIEEHINSISLYELSFFQKLVLIQPTAGQYLEQVTGFSLSGRARIFVALAGRDQHPSYLFAEPGMETSRRRKGCWRNQNGEDN